MNNQVNNSDEPLPRPKDKDNKVFQIFKDIFRSQDDITRNIKGFKASGLWYGCFSVYLIVA